MNARSARSEPKSLRLLFRPGTGGTPPRLAGREEEKERLKGLLDFALHGEAPPSPAVLIGPRGNGKTALLEAFARLCREAGADVFEATPDKIENKEALVAWLLEEGKAPEGERDEKGPLSRLPPAVASVVESVRARLPRVKPLGIPGLIGAEFADMPRGERRQVLLHLDELLTEACRERPRIAIMDEAHTLDAAPGRILLNTAQAVVRKGAPGIPSLMTHVLRSR